MGVEELDVKEEDLDEDLEVESGHVYKVTVTPGWTKEVLEVEDVLFHHDSAVVLPTMPSEDEEGGSGGDGGGIAPLPRQAGVTGLWVFRAALLHLEEAEEEENEVRVVVAGHTDTSGDTRYNFELSQLRGESVCHLLSGDRDAWAEGAAVHHQVEDYQLILKHFARLLLWPCDAGPVDNEYGDRTERGVLRFQAAYNENRESLGISGSDLARRAPSGGLLDEETWGAIYDLYEWELALITAGEGDPSALDPYRERVRFVDDAKKVIPCGESFPVEASEQDSFRSQTNRRVEVLFVDADDPPPVEHPEIRDSVWTEDEVPLYKKALTEATYVEPEELEFVPWMDIQTVDWMGYRVPDAELTLTFESDERPEATVTTDDGGHVRVHAVPVGQVEVRLEDGSLATFYNQGEETDAVLEARQAFEGLVRVVVDEAEEGEREEWDRHQDRYRRIPVRPDDSLPPPEEEELEGRGGTEQRRTRASYRLCVDNLLLAHGVGEGSDLNLDVSAFITETLTDWLDDHYGAVVDRGFFVYFIRYDGEQPVLDVRSSDGERLAFYRLTEDVSALLGAYSLFEGREDPIFRDMTWRRHIVVPGDPDEESEDGDDSSGTGAEGEGPDEGSSDLSGEPDEPNRVPISDVVPEDEHDDFVDLIASQGDKVRVLYYMHSLGTYANAALHGGTGTLEPYGSDGSVRSRIHERNLAVVEEHNRFYRGYIQTYEARVEATDTEDELRDVGPPMNSYMFPRPPGCSDDEYFELVDAHVGGSQHYHAWRAISDQIADIHDRRVGGPYLLGKFKLAPDDPSNPYQLGKAGVEYNLTLDSSGQLIQGDGDKVSFEFSAEDMAAGGGRLSRRTVDAGVTHEVNLETGETTNKFKVNLSRGGKGYGMELGSDGSAKVMGPYGTSSEFNPRERTFGAGVTLPIPGVGELYLGLHFQSVRDETVLKVITDGPGFFERRSVQELVAPRTTWNDLVYREQTDLGQLGFDQAFWDVKHTKDISEFPELCRVNPHDFDTYEPEDEDLHMSRALIALTHLGIYWNQWLALWRRVAATV